MNLAPKVFQATEIGGNCTEEEHNQTENNLNQAAFQLLKMTKMV